MNLMQSIDFLINQLLREPSIFLGIIVSLGMIFLKKKTHEIIISTIKTVVGIQIVQVGANSMVAATKPILDMIINRYGLEGRIADPWVGVGESLDRMAGTQLVSQIGFIMISAWLIHLLFSRFSKLKVVYLSAHLMFSDTILITFFTYAVTGWEDFRAILVSVLLLAGNWWFGPAIIAKPLKKIVGEEKITLGHNLSLVGFVAIWIAKLTGDPSKETEGLNYPQWLSVMQDPVVSFTVVISMMFLLIGILAGPEAGLSVSGAMNPIFFSFLQGVKVSVGIIIIIAGVKMFQVELIPAFEGFAKVVVPGAIPAVDAVVFWPYAPQAAILGVLFTILGMVTGVFLQIVFGSAFVTIPGAIPIISGGFTLGVLTSRAGGIRGTIISTYLLGIVHIFGSAWLAEIIGLQIAGGGHLDYCTFWPGIFYIIKIFAGQIN